MPLIAHNGLPAFDRLRAEGVSVKTPEASEDTLPSLRIGLLNLMPDAALRATDRQFIRLVAAYQEDANLFVYPFTLAAEVRGADAQAHIGQHYSTFEKLRDSGLDALIITGANPSHVDIANEAFWTGLIDVIDWAVEGVQSTLCSCLATHAVIRHLQGIDRTLLPQKRWGVYSHEDVADHYLLDGLESPVNAPHSHHFNLTPEEFEEAGSRVLVSGTEAGVHMAVSDDQTTFVFFQGHPEYDPISLLKEYKREISRFIEGARADYPPFPEHYFSSSERLLLDGYRRDIVEALNKGREQLPEFPESDMSISADRSWTRAGSRMYRNWLSEVHRRRKVKQS